MAQHDDLEVFGWGILILLGSEAPSLLREWKATAEIHADPALARRLRKPLDADGVQVTVPAG